MMWNVAYSDGILDPHEDMLLRQIAGLIHVPDKERGLARQRAPQHAARATNSTGTQMTRMQIAIASGD